MENPPNREALAYHEAGHAVAATVLSPLTRPVVSVSIVHEPGFHGYTLYHSFDDLIDRGEIDTTAEHFPETIRAEVIVLRAGPAAEFMGSGETHHTGNAGDFIDAATLVDRYLDNEDPEEFVKSLEGEADHLVAEHRDVIGAVASALLEEGTLEGDKVREIVSGCQ